MKENMNRNIAELVIGNYFADKYLYAGSNTYEHLCDVINKVIEFYKTLQENDLLWENEDNAPCCSGIVYDSYKKACGRHAQEMWETHLPPYLLVFECLCENIKLFFSGKKSFGFDLKDYDEEVKNDAMEFVAFLENALKEEK